MEGTATALGFKDDFPLEEVGGLKLGVGETGGAVVIKRGALPEHDKSGGKGLVLVVGNKKGGLSVFGKSFQLGSEEFF